MIHHRDESSAVRITGPAFPSRCAQYTEHSPASRVSAARPVGRAGAGRTEHLPNVLDEVQGTLQPRELRRVLLAQSVPRLRRRPATRVRSSSPLVPIPSGLTDFPFTALVLKQPCCNSCR